MIVPLIGCDLRRLQGGLQWPADARTMPRPTSRRSAEEAIKSAQWQAIMRTAREHDRTDTRWLDYELDVGKLLDYPLMTDMRDPLTQRFHRAKLRADLLRPADAGDLLDDSDAARQYRRRRGGVRDRVRRCGGRSNPQATKRLLAGGTAAALTRAHSALRIASDTAATPQERERAFDVARAGTRRADRAAGAHPRRDRARNRR